MAIRNIIQKAEQEFPPVIGGILTLPNTVVYTTGAQTIGGEKTFSASLFVFSGANVVFIDNTGVASGQWQFSNRPTLNGTGFLLSGEAAQLPETILYTTGNQIKSGRLIIGHDAGSIVDPNSSYTLSLQNNSSSTWLEILNYSGANKGVFFGIDNNNFEQWNYQGGDILFFTAENVSDGYVRLRIKNDGKVGIGTDSPSEKLEVAGNVIANNLVYNTGDQTIIGIKNFEDKVYIKNLFVTGTETILNTTNFNVQSPYLLLNLTGGANDGGIFFVTGESLTGINDYGPIIGFDHSDQFKFGIARRSDDLSSLKSIASTEDVALNYYAKTGNNIISGDNTFYSDKYIFSGADIVISGGTFNSNIRPFVNGTGVLLSGDGGQNSFIINLFNTSDTQAAGHNYFGNIAASFSTSAGGVNRRFPVLESCVVRKASWTNFNQTAGNPVQNCTGYFINTTTNTTGIISTTINTPTINLPTHYIATFSPPITISSGDFIVCSLFGPTYATTFPATVRNSVNLYCYN